MTLPISFIRKRLVIRLVAGLPVAGAAQLTNYATDKEGLFRSRRNPPAR